MESKTKQQNQVQRYREQTGSFQKPGQVQGQGQKKMKGIQKAQISSYNMS